MIVKNGKTVAALYHGVQKVVAVYHGTNKVFSAADIVKHMLMTLSGLSTQAGTPTPSAPIPILSVDSFTVQRKSASGNVLSQRTITPPKSLNSIGGYTDSADIENGVWIYNCDKFQLKDKYKVSSVSSGRITYVLADSKSTETFVRNIGMCERLTKSTWGTTLGTFGNGATGSAPLATIYAYFSAADTAKSDGDKYGDVVFLMAKPTPSTTAIAAADLAWLRSLAISGSETLSITDNHGRTVEFVLSE